MVDYLTKKQSSCIDLKITCSILDVTISGKEKKMTRVQQSSCRLNYIRFREYIKIMECFGWIEIKKVGRYVFVKITEAGQSFYNKLQIVISDVSSVNGVSHVDCNRISHGGLSN